MWYAEATGHSSGHIGALALRRGFRAVYVYEPVFLMNREFSSLFFLGRKRASGLALGDLVKQTGELQPVSGSRFCQKMT